MAGKQIADIAPLLMYVKRDRGSVTRIANRLGNPGPASPQHDWLILTPKANMPKPLHVFYPKPPKAADGSLLYERIPNKLQQQQQLLGLMDATNAAASAATATNVSAAGAATAELPIAKVGPLLNNAAAASAASTPAATAANSSTSASSSAVSTAAVTPMEVDGVPMAVPAPAAAGSIPAASATSQASSAALRPSSAALKRRIYDDSVNGVDRKWIHMLI